MYFTRSDGERELTKRSLTSESFRDPANRKSEVALRWIHLLMPHSFLKPSLNSSGGP